MAVKDDFNSAQVELYEFKGQLGLLRKKHSTMECSLFPDSIKAQWS